MDIRDLQDKLRDLSDKLPGDRADKIKMVAVAAVLPVLVIWLLYFAATSLTPPPAAEAVDTKGWTIAIGLNEALSADKAFGDVGFAVETEKPLRFVVNGAVHADQDLPRLIEKIKELRPEGDYDIRVEVLRPQAP